jgi:NAD-dependent deacetylase
MTSVQSIEERIEDVRAWIDAARRIVVLTGAGISTDSGIPDFRGPRGVWTRDPAAEKMASLRYYMGDSEVRKRAWATHLGLGDGDRQPNPGHRALVELEARGRLHTLITQNVDGLHQEAGTSPQLVVEIHGTLREVVCMACGERGDMQHALERVRAGEEDPACCSCEGILKSATIYFGQDLVREDLERAERAARDCDLLMAVGTSLAVYPIAEVVPIARATGARVVIVNAEPTDMDHLAHAVLRGSISELLPRLVASRG